MDIWNLEPSPHQIHVSEHTLQDALFLPHHKRRYKAQTSLQSICKIVHFTCASLCWALYVKRSWVWTQPGGTGCKITGCVEQCGWTGCWTVMFLQRFAGLFICTNINMPPNTCWGVKGGRRKCLQDLGFNSCSLLYSTSGIKHKGVNYGLLTVFSWILQLFLLIKTSPTAFMLHQSSEIADKQLNDRKIYSKINK